MCQTLTLHLAGLSMMERGQAGTHLPTRGPKVSPPPWAPKCPFSGLSLATATFCPTLPLGLVFGSSSGPAPTLGVGAGLEGPPENPHPAPPRAAIQLYPLSGKQLQHPELIREGPLGAPHVSPSSNQAPGQPAWGHGSLGRSCAGQPRTTMQYKALFSTCTCGPAGRGRLGPRTPA